MAVKPLKIKSDGNLKEAGQVFETTDHVSEYSGPQDAGKPVVLNALGMLDHNITLPGFVLANDASFVFSNSGGFCIAE